MDIKFDDEMDLGGRLPVSDRIDTQVQFLLARRPWDGLHNRPFRQRLRRKGVDFLPAQNVPRPCGRPMNTGPGTDEQFGTRPCRNCVNIGT